MLDYAGAGYTVDTTRRASSIGFLRHLDWPLFAAVAALVGYGLWAIAGITRNEIAGDPDYYAVRQAIFAAIGTVGFAAALLIDPALYRRFRWPIYGTMVALMLVVFVTAPVRGSTRWIDLGFFRFQPSEFGKVLFVLFLAGFLADRGKRVAQGSTLLAALGFAGLPVLLVFFQPDIGTALVYVAAFAAVVFVAETRWLHLSVLAAAAVAAAISAVWLLPAAGIQVLKPYQQARLLAFADPGRDPENLTWNVNQSVTAIGAGGLEGRGISGATQTNFDFIPEDATDFAFAAFAEQRGFVGAAVLLALYLFVVWRGLRVITVARDAFSATVAAGIVLAFLFQVFVNVGMTMGIAPVTGIPLPFLSLGGSSMISNLIAFGILQAIHARAQSQAAADRRRYA